MPNLLLDVRHAARTLRTAPGFTAAAVLTLGLGIGANAAIFSLLDAALLAPLPVAEPGRLVALATERTDGVNHNFSYPLYRDLRDSGVFAGLAVQSTADLGLTLWARARSGSHFQDTPEENGHEPPGFPTGLPRLRP